MTRGWFYGGWLLLAGLLAWLLGPECAGATAGCWIAVD